MSALIAQSTQLAQPNAQDDGDALALRYGAEVSLRGARGLGGGLLVSAVALEAFSFVTPLFTQLVIDKAISSADLDLLLVFGMSFCVLIVFQSFISYLRDWLVCRTGSTLNQSWTGGVFAHLMSLPEQRFLEVY